jgi:hypothetical protein
LSAFGKPREKTRCRSIVGRISVRPPAAAILPSLPRGQMSKTLWGSFEQLIDEMTPFAAARRELLK